MQTVSSTPNSRKVSSRKPQAQNWNATAKDRAKALRSSIDERVEALANAVDAVRASETFKAYLDVQARFHKYSWGNTMLIYSQRPDATRVAGFNTWKRLKRSVRKGEHGIRIFAPCPYKVDVETADGETDTETRTYFKVVHVFDVSQTDGEALPTVDCPTVDQAADDLLARLTQVSARRGVSVSFAHIESGAFGFSANGSVAVDNRHATGQQAKTLAHELAHEALHWDVKGTVTRNIAELEAESVAYVVCTHFGLDVEVRASRYIAIWDGDAKALRASLDRISKTARTIIDEAESADTSKPVAFVPTDDRKAVA